MAPKVRIQRKRRPWLHGETERLFALGSLITNILSVVATYGAAARKEEYDQARIRRLNEETVQKEVRASLLVEQTRRTELLNVQTLLELQGTFGPEKVQKALLGYEDKNNPSQLPESTYH